MVYEEKHTCQVSLMQEVQSENYVLVAGVWQPRVVGEEQYLPAHLPGLKTPNQPLLETRFLRSTIG